MDLSPAPSITHCDLCTNAHSVLQPDFPTLPSAVKFASYLRVKAQELLGCYANRSDKLMGLFDLNVFAKSQHEKLFTWPTETTDSNI